MSRLTEETNIRSASARALLASRTEPYYRHVEQGLDLGYRRGKRSGVWVARMRDFGKATYIEKKIGRADDDGAPPNGSGTYSFDQAVKRARELMALADAQRISGVLPQSEKKTVGDVLDHYVAGYISGAARKKGIPGRDLRNLNSILDCHVRPAFGNMRLENLNSMALKAWKAQLVLAPRLTRTGLPVGATIKTKRLGAVIEDEPITAATADAVSNEELLRKRQARANRVMTTLRAALNYAVKEHWIATDVAWREALKPYGEVDGPSIRYLTIMECEDLKRAADVDFSVMIRGALLTGCRYGSLRFITTGDVDLAARIAHVRVTKNGKSQVIRLTDNGAAFFAEAMKGKKRKDLLFTKANGEPWKPSDQKRRMKRACKVADIKSAITFHELRDTFASHLVMRGVPLLTVSKLLGHADVRTTEKYYAHLAPDYIHGELDKHLPDF